MEHELRSNLIACAEAFASARDLKLSTVGRLVANDGQFFERIKSGSFTARKYDEAIRWFDENWPDSGSWPVAVARPSQGGAQV
ncbi:hypothetical protein [Ancylobacter oerskovii]|uniref:Uncharacterized protein n=1 Tax=Ancylobacter oerskovii TaxID=459519 RepID=A0ABW4Z289_9HYPH|nr:hypothetical protein [Ancylobacter oerskovii]MBS7545084.1 hypothetical protein [Ancylobacter oerskovii]